MISAHFPSRLAHASQNMMLWFVLLFAAHQAIRLLVPYLCYAPAMVLCAEMELVICKKEKGRHFD
jgi:hypothetical protein